ncbi:MAG: anti-sigma factor antagonist [Clostridia bacterium]|nr:anti-sigma factor antagonist [Clostridia bacterium]
MKVEHFVEERILKILITEEIDHHTSSKIRTRMDYEILRFRPKKVIIDLKNVKFMDSAGVGLMIGRYKSVKSCGGNLEIENANSKLMKIFEMSGLPKIIEFRNTSELQGFSNEIESILI